MLQYVELAGRGFDYKGIVAELKLNPYVAKNLQREVRGFTPMALTQAILDLAQLNIARNEVKDAITNEYLSKFVDSVEEVYRCIVMLNGGPKSKVKICGGFLENVKRQKADAELMGLYNLAKESGLNTQGFVYMKLANSDLPTSVKIKLEETFKQDPYASPLVVQLKQQIGQLSTQLQAKDQTITLTCSGWGNAARRSNESCSCTFCE